MHVFAPHLKGTFPLGWTYEIFDLHLLELARAEQEIARRYFVAERLPYLCDSERQLRVERVDDILEVDENAASRLGAQIRNGRIVLACTYLRLEHHIELAHRPEISAAVRTFFFTLVGAESAFALLALD